MSQNLLFTFTAFAVSIVCGFVLIPQIMNFCARNSLYDIPNERKVHHNTIPRLGGICFIPSMLLAFILAIAVFNRVTGEEQITMNTWSVMFLISLLIIYVVGTIDDLIGLKAQTKFVLQILAATLMPLSGLYINNLYGFLGVTEIPFWIGAPLTVFVIVFVDNAMNLIDGIDGLAGGLSLLSLSGFLYCFMREGVWLYCILIAGLIGVLIPYLYYNIWGDPLRNRKIFMGDAGSLSLGFILGFLLIKFAMHNPSVMPYRNDSLIISYTLLIVPTFDVVRVIIARLRSRRPLFGADKNHIHHKLMRSGLTQHQSLVVILLLAVFFIVFNLTLDTFMPVNIIVILDVAVYVTFHLLLDMCIRNAGKKAFE